MEHLRSDLKTEYNRLCKLHNPDETTPDPGLSEKDILRAHFIVADFFLSEGEEVFFGVKNFNLLASAVSRQFVEFSGIKKWTTDFHKMATLFFGLTKNHAFEDGNKRTALLALLLHLNQCRLEPTCRKKDLELLCVRIAANQLNKYVRYERFAKGEDPEVNFIADFIRKNTRPRNKRFYSITYAEFDHNLRRFGVCLDDPSGGYINVYQQIDTRRFLFKKKVETRRIIQIGFPGWKRQVNLKALKEVLKAAGLVAENGYDSDVFFNGAEPTYKLVEEYREPLIRLKDK